MVFDQPSSQFYSLRKSFVKAVVFHLSLLLISLVMSFILGTKFFETKTEAKQLELVQSAVRVDVVAMPKLTLKELKKINLTNTREEREETLETKRNETSKVEFKKQSKKVNLAQLLKKISKKKSLKKKVKKRSQVKETSSSRELKKLVLEGNKVSKGLSLVGQNSQEVQGAFVQYIQMIPARVRPYWKLPSYLMEKGYRCRVKLFIGADGKIIKTEIYESSQNVEYDQRAVDAVREASPLMKPDASILNKVAMGEVILGFPL